VKASLPVLHQVDFSNQPTYGTGGGTGDFFNSSINLNTFVTACSNPTTGSMGTYGTKCSSKSKGISSPNRLVNYSLSMDLLSPCEFEPHRLYHNFVHHWCNQ